MKGLPPCIPQNCITNNSPKLTADRLVAEGCHGCQNDIEFQLIRLHSVTVYHPSLMTAVNDEGLWTWPTVGVKPVDLLALQWECGGREIQWDGDWGPGRGGIAYLHFMLTYIVLKYVAIFFAGKWKPSETIQMIRLVFAWLSSFMIFVSSFFSPNNHDEAIVVFNMLLMVSVVLMLGAVCDVKVHTRVASHIPSDAASIALWILQSISLWTAITFFYLQMRLIARAGVGTRLVFMSWYLHAIMDVLA
eukprot:gene14982-616_t